MAENPATQIYMSHPKLPKAKPVATTVGALNGVWADKGWRRDDSATSKKTTRRSASTDTQAESSKPASGKNQEG